MGLGPRTSTSVADTSREYTYGFILAMLGAPTI